MANSIDDLLGEARRAGRSTLVRPGASLLGSRTADRESLIMLLEGGSARSADDLCALLVRQLMLPEHYASNWDAFQEGLMLTPERLGLSRMVMIVADPQLVLSKDVSNFEVFVKIIHSTREYLHSQEVDFLIVLDSKLEEAARWEEQ